MTDRIKDNVARLVHVVLGAGALGLGYFATTAVLAVWMWDESFRYAAKMTGATLGALVLVVAAAVALAWANDRHPWRKKKEAQP